MTKTNLVAKSVLGSLALAALFVSFSPPAQADDHHDRGGDRYRGYERAPQEPDRSWQERDRGWQQHEVEARRWHHAYRRSPPPGVVYAPPVVYSPPPPQPEGFNLIIPLNFR